MFAVWFNALNDFFKLMCRSELAEEESDELPYKLNKILEKTLKDSFKLKSYFEFDEESGELLPKVKTVEVRDGRDGKPVPEFWYF
jgi:hypothetical protein